MSDKKKIVIKRRLLPEIQPNEQQISQDEPTADTRAVEEPRIEPVEPEAQPTQNTYLESINSFNLVQERIRDIREKDRSIQRVFKKWDEVDLKSVKKKLNQLSDERNAILADAQTTENLLNEALAVLETEMSELEEQLFDRLVEVEYLREKGASLRDAENSKLRALESEIEELRNKIAESKTKMSELQLKLDNIRSLPRTINKLTTSTEEAEPLYKELVAKYRDEARVSSAIEKIVQDEGVPRPYAIIHLWKAALKPRVSGQP